MGASGRYYLNDIDMYEEYGFFVSSGSGSILTLPERKEVLSFDKPGNGSSYFTTYQAKFKNKEIVLSGGIKASSSSEFASKFNSLKAVFGTPGFKELKCHDIELPVQVMLRRIQNLKRMTRIIGASTIVVLFELVLIGNFSNSAFPAESTFYFKINGQPLIVGGENLFVN